jgi:hypothetical protein
VKRIARLAGLEEDIRILRAAAQLRAIRVEAARAVGAHGRWVDHRPQVVGRRSLDRRQFMTGAEAVEEVQERHPRVHRRGVGHSGEVRGLLHACWRTASRSRSYGRP